MRLAGNNGGWLAACQRRWRWLARGAGVNGGWPDGWQRRRNGNALASHGGNGGGHNRLTAADYSYELIARGGAGGAPPASARRGHGGGCALLSVGSALRRAGYGCRLRQMGRGRVGGVGARARRGGGATAAGQQATGKMRRATKCRRAHDNGGRWLRGGRARVTGYDGGRVVRASTATAARAGGLLSTARASAAAAFVGCRVNGAAQQRIDSARAAVVYGRTGGSGRNGCGARRGSGRVTVADGGRVGGRRWVGGGRVGCRCARRRVRAMQRRSATASRRASGGGRGAGVASAAGGCDCRDITDCNGAAGATANGNR